MNFYNIAKLGYEAYSLSTNNKNYKGEEMPKFDDLPDAIKKSWIDAAQEIVNVAVNGALA